MNSIFGPVWVVTLVTRTLIETYVLTKIGISYSRFNVQSSLHDFYSTI